MPREHSKGTKGTWEKESQVIAFLIKGAGMVLYHSWLAANLDLKGEGGNKT